MTERKNDALSSLSDGYSNTHKNGERSIESHLIVGFVVNVHDPLNFDIDLLLTRDQEKQYQSIIKNEYKYHDETDQQIKSSYAYRCRLRGIGSRLSIVNNNKSSNYSNRTSTSNSKNNKFINNKSNDSNYKKDQKMMKWKLETKRANIAINRIIDRLNGWVFVSIFESDMYNRLLIDLINPITNEEISPLKFSQISMNPLMDQTHKKSTEEINDEVKIRLKTSLESLKAPIPIRNLLWIPSQGSDNPHNRDSIENCFYEMKKRVY